MIKHTDESEEKVLEINELLARQNELLEEIAKPPEKALSPWDRKTAAVKNLMDTPTDNTLFDGLKSAFANR